ncbi:MAG: 4-hydroxythreonine-4-phosphate dehydrogenase PdxA [Sphingobacteriales bacterium]|nr:MAG: 4-hydroxythreonine-4-phosphate dehydrogenase PdxA [Sphingobacteriales bacterium]
MEPSQALPVIGFSCGDLNGIGIETILKLLADPRIAHQCIPVVFASEKAIGFYAAKRFTEEKVPFRVIQSFDNLESGHNYLFTAWNEEVSIQPGVLTDSSGKYAVRSLQVAAQCLKDGQLDGLVTAPINKANTQSEHFAYTGHTPFLQDFFGAKSVLMVLHDASLRVALVTEHLPVSAIAAHITTDRVLQKLTLFRNTLVQDFGIDKPRIAVLGLNPHAGDGGAIGSEEDTLIKPAIDQAQQNGILAFGPYAADAFFARGSYTGFHGVLAMYHDQGLIPFKTLAQSGGVNFTAGLSVIRTSPDHGTAFDIAGQGIADPTSMREALFECIDRIRQRAMYTANTANPLPRSRVQKERTFGGHRD